MISQSLARGTVAFLTTAALVSAAPLAQSAITGAHYGHPFFFSELNSDVMTYFYGEARNLKPNDVLAFRVPVEVTSFGNRTLKATMRGNGVDPTQCRGVRTDETNQIVFTNTI